MTWNLQRWEITIDPSFTEGRWHWSAARALLDGSDLTIDVHREGDEDTAAAALTEACAFITAEPQPEGW